ncbi:MAG: methyl-accepting chemotaxis protein [bacterium]|nr:methyl-accepting chemotaxis protein [bacterium]
MGSYVSEGTSIADAQTHLLTTLRLERTFQEEQKPELLEKRSAILGQLKGDLEQVIELENSASHVEMAQALLETKATHEQTFQALVQALATRGATEKEGLQTSQFGILLLLGVSLAIGLLVSVRMLRAILNPIKLLHGSLEDLVSGSRDLTRRGDSALGEFLDVNDAIASRLEELIVEINQRSNAMEQSSHELEASSRSVSESTLSQADSITSVNSTLSGITSTVEQATSHAHGAHTLAVKGSTFAESGNGQILEMQSAMEGISQASEQVTTVIKVIEDIAF